MKKIMFMALVVVGFFQISKADDISDAQAKTLAQEEQKILDDSVTMDDIARADICAQDLATCEMDANGYFDNSYYSHNVLVDNIETLRRAVHVSYLTPTEMELVKKDLKIMEDRHQADLAKEQTDKDAQTKQDNCRVWDFGNFCWKIREY